jgi:outer membrane lipoprotein SlyB
MKPPKEIAMKKIHRTLVVLTIMMTASTAWADYACPSSDSKAGGWMPPECVQAHKALCADCGIVEAVNVVQTDEASGLGAVAGAVVGGVIGNQIGKGKGKTVATVGGAVVGGVAGHYGEKMLRKKDRWDVVVLMEDSTHRTVSFDADPGYKAGDKVKVSDNNLTRQ